MTNAVRTVYESKCVRETGQLSCAFLGTKKVEPLSRRRLYRRMSSLSSNMCIGAALLCGCDIHTSKESMTKLQHSPEASNTNGGPWLRLHPFFSTQRDYCLVPSYLRKSAQCRNASNYLFLPPPPRQAKVQEKKSQTHREGEAKQRQKACFQNPQVLIPVPGRPR